MTFEKGTIAVIFVSQRSTSDPEGYAAAAEQMEEAATRFPGFCGIHSVRDTQGVGITVSYWETEEAARRWKENAAHSAVREQGRDHWYLWYDMIVAEVVRSYDWRAH